MPSYLTDSSSQVWQIGVLDTGAYTTTPVSGPTGVPFIALIDQATPAIWALSVDTTGDFLLNPLSPTSAQGFIFATSPFGVLYEIFVKNETLYTIPAGAIPASTGPIKCLPILIAPNGTVWQLGINDSGLLTTTQVFINFKYLQGITLIGSTTTWKLAVNNFGFLTTTQNPFPFGTRPFPYIPLFSSPNNLPFSLPIDDPG